MRIVQRAKNFVIHGLYEKKLRDFIALFRPENTGHSLIRIGGGGDGGYLVPNDLQSVRHCFSPGVSDTANFEGQLANDHDIQCYLADASVSQPPIEHPNFQFDRKFLGAATVSNFITLEDWMAAKLPRDDASDCLLQMDIEGAELDVLESTDIDVLNRFSIIVIELHDMGQIVDARNLNRLYPIFAKLRDHFAVCHLHPNNCCGTVVHRDIEIPRVFEVTYLRRDRCLPSSPETGIELPHLLDEPNVEGKPDLIMPDIWWKS